MFRNVVKTLALCAVLRDSAVSDTIGIKNRFSSVGFGARQDASAPLCFQQLHLSFQQSSNQASSCSVVFKKLFAKFRTAGEISPFPVVVYKTIMPPSPKIYVVYFPKDSRPGFDSLLVETSLAMVIRSWATFTL